MNGPAVGSDVANLGVPRGGVFLITGASSGIGAATASSLARGGASLVLVGRDQAQLETVERGLPGDGDSMVGVADVRDLSSLERVVTEAMARFGRLDGVVAAAGVGSFAPLLDTPGEVLREVVEVNLLGVIHTVRATAAAVGASTAGTEIGKIVLVGSASGRRGTPGLAAYSASKSALYGLADALRVELGPRIRISVVAPASTRTAFFERSFGDAGPARGVDAEESAAQVVKALQTGAPAVDARFLARWRAGLNALAPSLVDRWVGWRTKGWPPRRGV